MTGLIKKIVKIVFVLTRLDKVSAFLFRKLLINCVKHYPDLFALLKKQKVQNKNVLLLKNIPLKGNDIHLNGEISITHPRSCVFGNNIHIGDNAFFFTRGGLTIGDNTHVSRNVTIYTSNHDYNGRCLPYDDNYKDKPVYIGENVWIGMNVNIAPGVSIGEGAIIGIGSTVFKDVAPFSIIGTSEPNYIKSRNTDHYNELIRKAKFGGVSGTPTIVQRRQDLEELSPIFAVGTGRCGSSFLASFLNNFNEVNFLHEPNYQLIKLSSQYLHGEVSRNDVKLQLEHIFKANGKLNTAGVYGESDQKISNLIDIYDDIFPKAKFIWLIRSAPLTVASTFSRGWFSDTEFSLPFRPDLNVAGYSKVGNVYAENRPNGGKTVEFTDREWQEMSPFERNCWYWFFWNSLIKKQLNKLDSNRWHLQRIESISEDYSDLLNFLGVNVSSKLPKNSFKAINRAKYPLHSQNDFTEDQRIIFDKWCKELNEEIYNN